jgi:uncharacterized iron-regulated membrane protein
VLRSLLFFARENFGMNKKPTGAIRFWSAKNMYRYHSWIGFKVNILMFIICLTGAFATISHELDWLLISSMRVEPQSQEIAWQAMYESVSEQYPDIILGSLNAPDYKNFASTGNGVDPHFGSRRLIFNPHSGELLEQRHWYLSTQRILRDVHRYLLYPVVGIYIVGIFGFILLGSTITSLFIYKRWWRGFVTLRLHKGKRIFWGDFHKLIGIWSLWFLLLIGVTGSWYLVEALIRDAGINIQPEPPSMGAQYLQAIGPTPSIISISEVLNIAAREMPSLKIRTIRLPRKVGQFYFVAGETSSWWVRDRANHLIINPFNGEVLQKQVAEEQNALNYWADMADPLHFGDLGEFGGFTVKVIWFLFGLGLPVMSATGTWLWVRRVSKKMQRHGIETTSAPRKYRLWVFKPLSISIIVIGLSIGTVGITYFTFKSGSPVNMQSLGEKAIGPWRVELKGNIATISDKFMLDIACDNCIPNFHQASIARGISDDRGDLRFQGFNGGSDPFFGILSAQIANDANAQGVTIRIEDRNQHVFFAEFP